MSTMIASRKSRLIKRLIAGTLGIILAAAMLMNTTFLSGEESTAAGPELFSAEGYAEENFASVIVPWVQENAVPAADLYEAIAADVDAAGEEFGGRAEGSSWAFPVSFTGVAGEVNPTNGYLPVTIDGLPDDVQVIVQTGPPVNGAALRDVTGDIAFGMFKNQMEYQSVAVQLNNKVREIVLADVDGAALNGRTISVTGAFSYGNPAVWTVTPVEIGTEG